jgi:hypothetical protein
MTGVMYALVEGVNALCTIQACGSAYKQSVKVLQYGEAKPAGTLTEWCYQPLQAFADFSIQEVHPCLLQQCMAGQFPSLERLS